VARRGGHEQAFADGQIFIFESEGKVASLASSGFVRFIKDAEVESFTGLHRLAHDAGGLVGAEDDFRAGKLGVQKSADAGGVRGDFKIQIGLRGGQRV